VAPANRFPEQYVPFKRQFAKKRERKEQTKIDPKSTRNPPSEKQKQQNVKKREKNNAGYQRKRTPESLIVHFFSDKSVNG
jgi:hypothetical protein